MPTEAKSALGAKLLAMDAGAITLGKSLERRLAACRVRLRLQKKRLRIGKPGGKPRWFNWGNVENNQFLIDTADKGHGSFLGGKR